MAETKVLKARIDSVDSTTIENDSILNADINSAAAILDTKLAQITTAGKVDFGALIVASEAQGDIMYRDASAWVRLAAGTSGQFLKTLGTGANPAWDTVAAGGLSVKTGFFNRDTSLASGTQAVTGVGFQPKAVIFFMMQDGAAGEASWGSSSDDGSHMSISDTHISTANAYTNDTTNSIVDNHSGSAIYQGRIQSFDSDGFTITWNKVGSPTGTIRTIFLALK